MVRESVNLLELLRKQAAGGDLDFLREAVAVLAEAVMEAEVAAQIGAGHGERSPERTTWRNGYRPRRWDTRAGTIELQIPKLRQGSYFPALLEPRRRAERARRPRGGRGRRPARRRGGGGVNASEQPDIDGAPPPPLVRADALPEQVDYRD